MRYVKIIMVCFFVSCSCSKNDSDIIEYSVPVLFDGAISKEENVDTQSVDTIADFKPSENAIIESDSTIDTNYVQEKPLKMGYTTEIKKNTNIVKHSEKKFHKEDKNSNAIDASVEYACFNFSEHPLTSNDAFECSRHHWRVAIGLMENNLIDSAYAHCKRSLVLYENGSVFFLKAQLLYHKKEYAKAIEASEISLDRHDHWRSEDKEQSMMIKCASLKALYEKYPSQRIHKKLEKDCLTTF